MNGRDTPVHGGAKHVELYWKAVSALRSAWEALGDPGLLTPGPVPDLESIDAELAATQHRLREYFTGPDTVPDGQRLLAIGRGLAQISDIRYEIRGHVLGERLRRIEQLDAAIAVLHRERTTAGLLERVCPVVADYCEFDRVLLSRVDRSTWQPWRSYARVARDTEERFRMWLRTAPQIRLRHLMPEADIARRGRAALINAADPLAGVPHELMAAAGLTTYVAVPLTAGTRVIGFLHADRADRDVVAADRDVLTSFVGRFDRLFEHIALVERLAGQRDRLRDSMRATQTLLDEYGEADIELDSIVSDSISADAPASRPEHDELSSLTAREREVLALLATGATNARIADTLVITGETVKFHVKGILRKLRVENRAEAATLYLRLTIGAPRGQSAISS
ncbi:helix-turn-helix transcriptional regulator [Nocardia jiangxiensis]|uniref:LuxR C-terminal-related transcriptional regulator n=1 Tax=Nocardia jiangxiensis TaxID=282685 RepID=A0ABW6S9D8_9NOCA|nr:LuxR family transcriptional regulator [Nocardia jiangxiensis]